MRYEIISSKWVDHEIVGRKLELTVKKTGFWKTVVFGKTEITNLYCDGWEITDRYGNYVAHKMRDEDFEAIFYHYDLKEVQDLISTPKE
jgi:hypothetical protein